MLARRPAADGKVQIVGQLLDSGILFALPVWRLGGEEAPMSILQLERRIQRLNRQIAASQVKLGGLKEQRKALKSQLEFAKRAAKNGHPLEAEPIGLMGGV